MTLSFDRQIAIKRVLMEELSRLKAGNPVIFKLIVKLDTCEDLDSFLQTLAKTVTLLIDEKAGAEIVEKVKNAL
jgi:hypothetical protein